MHRIAALVIAVGACAAPDDRVQRNGGGGGGDLGGSGVDAQAAPDTPTAGVLRGVVCVATDLHAPAACITKAGAGLPVSELVSGTTDTTSIDSSFALDVGNQVSALVDVGTNGDLQLTPSVAVVDDTSAPAVVPMTNAAYLENLEADLGAVVPDGSGIIALYVVDGNGAPRPGVSAVPPPGITAGPYYDDATAIGWASGGTTGAIGGVLIFGVPEGTADVALSNGGPTFGIGGVRVVAGHVTFERVADSL